MKKKEIRRERNREEIAATHISTSWSFLLDQVHFNAYWDNFLTPKECQNIIRLGKKNLKIASVGVKKPGVNLKTRKSKVSWVFPSQAEWLFRRLTDTILSLNKDFFGFELWGSIEGCQFTCYKQPDDHYRKHVDRMHNNIPRKLSFTVNLSDPKDYEGGELWLYDSEEGLPVKKTQGTLYAFPSFLLHEVKPVTKGVRYSLVGWITGPSFK